MALKLVLHFHKRFMFVDINYSKCLYCTLSMWPSPFIYLEGIANTQLILFRSSARWTTEILKTNDGRKHVTRIFLSCWLAYWWVVPYLVLKCTFRINLRIYYNIFTYNLQAFMVNSLTSLRRSSMWYRIWTC